MWLNWNLPGTLPSSVSIGSDHSRSQNNPFLGISSVSSVLTVKAVDFIQIRKCLQLRGNARVHGDKLAIDDATQRHVVEHQTKGVEDLLVVLDQHFLSERERNGHLSALVVPAQEHKIAAVIDLHANQQEHHFNRVHSPIHVVAQK